MTFLVPQTASNLHPPLKNKGNQIQNEHLFNLNKYSYLKYGAVGAAFLIVSGIINQLWSSTFLSSNNTSSNSTGMTFASNSSSQTNTPLKSAGKLTSISPLSICPNLPNFFSHISPGSNLPFTPKKAPHLFHNRSAPSIWVTPTSPPAISTLSAGMLNQTTLDEMKCLLSSKPKLPTNDSNNIDLDEFSDILAIKAENITWANSLPVSTSLGTIAATIAYFATEYFYPALEEISHLEESVSITTSVTISDNAPLYKQFLEQLSAITQSEGKIEQTAVLSQVIEIIKHILIPENSLHAQLGIHTLNKLRNLRFDYLQTIQNAAQSDKLQTARTLISQNLDILIDSLCKIITKTHQITLENQSNENVLDTLKLLVQNMFKIITQVQTKIVTQASDISKKVITQYRRESISQQVAAITFVASALFSYLWITTQTKSTYI